MAEVTDCRCSARAGGAPPDRPRPSACSQYRGTGLTDYASVTLLLKDSVRRWRGGLLGAMWGRCLHIQILWVAEPLRGPRAWPAIAGSGRNTRGRAAAVSMPFLETFSFQAPRLLPEARLRGLGEADDWPAATTHYFLRKRLEPRS
jgi:hypothetical protein